MDPMKDLLRRMGIIWKALTHSLHTREGIITREDYIALLKRKEKRLAEVGVEDLHLRGSHVLLSLDSSGTLLRDDEGVPEMRICNFELLRRTG